jgi:hypothetical protein
MPLYPCRSFASVAFPPEGGVISSTHHATLPPSLLTLGYSPFGRSVGAPISITKHLGWQKEPLTAPPPSRVALNF